MVALIDDEFLQIRHNEVDVLLTELKDAHIQLMALWYWCLRDASFLLQLLLRSSDARNLVDVDLNDLVAADDVDRVHLGASLQEAHVEAVDGGTLFAPQLIGGVAAEGCER
jgi:hypothetical protein